MTTIVKIVLTVVAIVVATFLIGALKAGTGSDSPGVFGLVIGGGLIAGIVAIWKYKPENDNTNDIHKLNKD
jgi:hypothetical protein